MIYKLDDILQMNIANGVNIDYTIETMIDDLAIFIKAVECGNLSKAANVLGMTPATVSRRLQKLEESLSCRLVNRTARQFTLTKEGEKYYSECSGLVNELEARTKNLNAFLHQTSGGLKVLAPGNLAVGALKELWSEFSKEYPEIKLELNTNNAMENFLDSRADIAIRIGPQKDSDLYQKKLGEIKTVLAATPSYLNKNKPISTPEALNGKFIVAIKYIKDWKLTNYKNMEKANITVTGNIEVTDVRLAANLCSNSLGIGLLPVSEIKNQLESGELVRILPDWQGPTREIFAIWAGGRTLNKRARLMLDKMQFYINQQPVLQGKIPAKIN